MGVKTSANQLKLSKRGVYAITGDGKLKSFRLIRWEEILKTLEEPRPRSNGGVAGLRSRTRP